MRVLGSSEKENKILTGTIMETKCGAETEGKSRQRLPYLAIHSINNHQTPTLLWTARSASQRSMPWLSLEGPCQSLTHI